MNVQELAGLFVTAIGHHHVKVSWGEPGRRRRDAAGTAAASEGGST